MAAGAELVQPRVLEVNLRFDDPQDGLQRTGRVLRLRQDSRAWLTLKLPVGPWGTQAKTLRELELEVSDLKTARQILVELGFRVWFIYEKVRESYHLGEVEVSLDRLPFGSFVEIEGTLEQIAAAVEFLGLGDAERITTGYVTLFREARDRLNLPFDDCTFENWEKLAAD
jgi:adenylate cyclase class 2